MKKIFTTSVLFAVLAITATTADAKSWRINNDVTQKADFTDLNAAMSSNDVVADDTLYVLRLPTLWFLRILRSPVLKRHSFLVDRCVWNSL